MGTAMGTQPQSIRSVSNKVNCFFGLPRRLFVSFPQVIWNAFHCIRLFVCCCTTVLSNAGKIWHWILYVMQMVVRITFNDFSTETRWDYVRIHDGFNYSSNTITTLSGIDVSVSDMSFSSTQQYMYIYFSADSSVVSRGFSATFESIRKKVLLLCFKYYWYRGQYVRVMLLKRSDSSVSGPLRRNGHCSQCYESATCRTRNSGVVYIA